MPREIKDGILRERKIHPMKCARGSFRTVHNGKATLVVCCPKGKWKRGRCQVGMKLQSIRRPIRRKRRSKR